LVSLRGRPGLKGDLECGMTSNISTSWAQRASGGRCSLR
jgi:hypothetical protein